MLRASPFETKCFLTVVLLGALFRGATLSSAQVTDPDIQKHPVRVADAIGMTRIAGSPYPAVRPKTGFAVFSPDGSRFAIVLSKGNIGKNTNDYSLLVFRAADVSHGGNPKKLVSLSVSSNRPGIQSLEWSNDNDTIFFLGAREEEATQLYSVQCSSGKLTKITNHPTALTSYAISEKGHTIVFTAETSEHGLISENVLHNGFHVEREAITDLIRGRIHDDYHAALFVRLKTSATGHRLRTMGPLGSDLSARLLSPDGRYLIVKTDTSDVSPNWSEYEDTNVKLVFRRKQTKGFPTGFLRYELIDTKTGRTESVLDSPASYFPSDVIWSPNSRSFLLCGVLLPLNVNDPAERQSRRSRKFVAEVTLPNRTITTVTSEDLNPIRWDPRTNIVEFQARQNLGQQGTPNAIYYRKTGDVWRQVADATSAVNDVRPNIIAEQDLNLPPTIVAIDPRTKQKRVLLDLNPEFAGLAFGKVEEISWKDVTGNPVSGALYLPPNYNAGERYPLVIQTHGFEPHTFVIDGSHMTASAAQPMASSGIVVLQIKDIFLDSLVTPQEPERAMSAYENAIEYLDQTGIIDPARVGLVGFSRTCLYVKYALTHSSRHFAAAVVADGVDAGYFQYLMFYNIDPTGAAEFDRIIGGPPYGAGLSLWLKESPGFLLEKVQSPLQIQALGRESVLNEWEWFAGLRRLDKPVDLLYLPKGTHILVKPWDRLISQEGTLDWFRFWLKGEEDPDPAKADQYTRWRELRKLQQSNEAGGKPN